MTDEHKQPVDLKIRTKKFAVQIIRLFVSLPRTTEAQVIGKQFLRSGTSVGAHYREGIRAKSDADIVNKLESSLQELDETAYWFEVLEESRIAPNVNLVEIQKECHELLAIIVTIVLKIKARPKRKKP